MEPNVQFTGRGARRRKEHDFAGMAVGDVREFKGEHFNNRDLKRLRDTKRTLARYYGKPLGFEFTSAVDYDRGKVYVKRVK